MKNKSKRCHWKIFSCTRGTCTSLAKSLESLTRFAMSEYFKKYITVTGSLENSFVKSANLAFDLHTWNWIIVYFLYFIAIIISIERLRKKIDPEKERFFDVTRYPYNNSTLFDRLQLSKFLKSRYYEIAKRRCTKYANVSRIVEKHPSIESHLSKSRVEEKWCIMIVSLLV